MKRIVATFLVVVAMLSSMAGPAAARTAEIESTRNDRVCIGLRLWGSYVADPVCFEWPL